MLEINNTFVIDEVVTMNGLYQCCEDYGTKFNCRPTVLLSKKRLSTLLDDNCKGYRLTTKEDEYKVPNIIQLEKFTIIETKEENDLIYIITVQ